MENRKRVMKPSYKLKFGTGTQDRYEFAGVECDQIRWRKLEIKEWEEFFRSQCFALYKEPGNMPFDPKRVPNRKKNHYVLQTPHGEFYVPQDEKKEFQEILQVSQSVNITIRAGYCGSRLDSLKTNQPKSLPL